LAKDWRRVGYVELRGDIVFAFCQVYGGVSMVKAHLRMRSWQYVILAASIVFSCFIVWFGLPYSERSVSMIYDEFRRRAVLAFEGEDYQTSYRNLKTGLIIRADGDPVVNSLFALFATEAEFPCLIHEPEFGTFVKHATTDGDPAIRGMAEHMVSRAGVYAEVFYDFGENSVRPFLREGWAANEGPYPNLGFPTFVWAVGKSSELDVFICREESNKILTFRVYPFPVEQSINLIINETIVESIKLVKAWEEYAISVNCNYLNYGSNKITFIYKDAQSPSKSGSSDRRELAVAFDWIRIENAHEKASRGEGSQGAIENESRAQSDE
jgi:hypothetical protein